MYVKENKRNNEMKQEKEKRNGKREEKKFLHSINSGLDRRHTHSISDMRRRKLFSH